MQARVKNMPSLDVEVEAGVSPHPSLGDREAEEEGKDKKEIGPGKGLFNHFKRFWYYVVIILIGVKWSIIETFTRHRKMSDEEISELKSSSKTVVITGGARGIGAQVVKKCLEQDLNVIIGCRKPSAGEDLISKLRDDGITTGTAEAFPLDLNSLSSVRLFAQSVLKKNKPIHILINNAGVMFPPFQVTGDGYEAQFQTNYLSHFMLTMLLLPALNSGGSPEEPSRVVNVSSIAHHGGEIDFDNIDMKYDHSPHKLYMSSKLMQVISTLDLDRKVQEEKLNIRVHSLHPGVIKSDLYQNVWFFKYIGLLKLMFKTPEQGADGIMFVGRSPSIKNEGGTYFANCRQRSFNPIALDQEVQQKLYTMSRTLCGMSKNDNLSGRRLGFQINGNGSIHINNL